MKVGLIGCGQVADGHMTVYKNITGVEVVAVADPIPKKARTFATKHGISRTFTDYVNLLEVKELDFVDICTPTSTHARIACDVAKFGHNVLLEKPMALSTSECEKIIHQSKKHGGSLCVCHNQIFFPSIRRAKSMVDLQLYDLVSFRTSVKQSPHIYKYPPWNMTAEEGGILWEAGCHPAYLQLHFLENITEVYAVGSKVKYPVYDEFAVLLRSPGQSYGIIEVSWVAEGSEKTYEITSADGKRAWPQVHGDYHSILELEKPELGGAVYSEIKRVLRHILRSRHAVGSHLGYFVGHFYLIKSYMKSLKDGSPPPVPPEEGKKTVRLLECIEQSLNTHEAVPLQ